MAAVYARGSGNYPLKTTALDLRVLTFIQQECLKCLIVIIVKNYYKNFIIWKIILQGLLFLFNEIACINLQLTTLIIHFFAAF